MGPSSGAELGKLIFFLLLFILYFFPPIFCYFQRWRFNNLMSARKPDHVTHHAHDWSLPAVASVRPSVHPPPPVFRVWSSAFPLKYYLYAWARASAFRYPFFSFSVIGAKDLTTGLMKRSVHIVFYVALRLEFVQEQLCRCSPKRNDTISSIFVDQM